MATTCKIKIDKADQLKCITTTLTVYLESEEPELLLYRNFSAEWLVNLGIEFLKRTKAILISFNSYETVIFNEIIELHFDCLRKKSNPTIQEIWAINFLRKLKQASDLRLIPPGYVLNNNLVEVPTKKPRKLRGPKRGQGLLI